MCVGGISPKTLRRVLSSLLVPPRTSLSFCMSFCSHRAAKRLSPPIKTELHLPLALLRSDFGLCRCRFTLQAPTCHLAGVDAIITQLVWSPLSLDWENKLQLYSAHTLTGLQLFFYIWSWSLRKSNTVNIFLKHEDL